jgi:hypothetical protein
MRIIAKAKELIKKYRFVIIIFAIFIIPRLIWLGWDEWNVDAQRWQIRSDAFVQAILKGDLKHTYQSYHPGVTVTWLSGFSKYAFYKAFETVFGYKVYVSTGYVYPEKFFITSFFAKFPLVLAISLLLTYSISLLRKLSFDKKYLIIFALLLSFEPYYLGITRFLHLTGLESAFVFSSFISVYYYLNSEEKKKEKFLWISAVLLGLGILTKMSAIIIAPYLFAVIGLYLFDFKYIGSSLTNIIGKYFVFVCIVCIVFVALFPATWHDPLSIISKMRNDGIGDTAFTDAPHESILKNPYLYYYEILFVKSLGVTIITLLIGVYLLVRNKINNLKVRNLLIIAGLYLVYYFFILAFPSKQMTRYTAVIYPFVLLLSSYAVFYIVEKLKNNWKYFVGFLVLYYVIILQAIFPVFSTFHTELLGEYAGYSKIRTIYNDGEHYLQVGQYLNEIGGKEAYDYALVLPSGNKDMSVGYAFLGTAFTNSVKGDKKYKNIFIAPDYFTLDKVAPECEYLRGFGHRWPFKFDFLYLYKCPGN